MTCFENMIQKTVEMLFSLVKRVQEPKIYSVVLSWVDSRCESVQRQHNTLKCVAAYSLEEAIEQAAQQIKEDEETKDCIVSVDLKPVLYLVRTLDELLRGFNDTQIASVEEKIDPKVKRTKNDLLSLIIRNRDKRLYEKEKDDLSIEERQMVEAFLYKRNV